MARQAFAGADTTSIGTTREVAPECDFTAERRL
jgi:hypothetical protein